jgi:hypothetical protein
VNIIVSGNEPLLFFAARKLDSADLIRHIIEAGATYNEQLKEGSYNDPLLAYCIDNSCFNVAKYLISRDPNFIQQQDHNGNYLIQLANKKLARLEPIEMNGRLGFSVAGEIAEYKGLIALLQEKKAPTGYYKFVGATKKRRPMRVSRRNKRTGRSKKVKRTPGSRRK